MTALTFLFSAAAVMLSVLATLTVWAPRRLGVKLVALTASLLFLPLWYAALADLLSRPKPVALEWWLTAAKEATVLEGVLKEGEGIYLWLQIEGVEEPRAYVLPWDRDLAEQLQEAMREAEERRGRLRMRLPFEPSWDNREPKFYAPPQPAPPPKEVLPPPKVYVPEAEA